MMKYQLKWFSERDAKFMQEFCNQFCPGIFPRLYPKSAGYNLFILKNDERRFLTMDAIWVAESLVEL